MSRISRKACRMVCSVAILAATVFPALQGNNLMAQKNTSETEIIQWRGPERNGNWPSENLLREWPENGPEKLWINEDIGMGFSSAISKDGMIYVTGKQDSLEVIYAIDTEGKLIWNLAYGLAPGRSYPETRVTPTIEGNRAYLISGRGQVVCVDLEQREILWSVDAYDRYEGAFGYFEIVESPLIVDDKIIYTPAGTQTTMVAFDKMNGDLIWKTRSLRDSTAYVSPICFERGGKQIIVNVLRNNIVAVDASNGDLFWSYLYSAVMPHWHSEAFFNNAVSPLYHDGKFFVTSGYNHTGIMFQVSEDGNTITELWKQPVLDTHHGGIVYNNGYMYGSTWIDNRQGNWVCIDWQSGEVKYETEWETKGSIILSDELLILYDERRGKVALVEPSPEEFRLLSFFEHEEGSGPHWAHPTVSDGILYIRHGQTVSAYKISE